MDYIIKNPEAKNEEKEIEISEVKTVKRVVSIQRLKERLQNERMMKQQAKDEIERCNANIAEILAEINEIRENVIEVEVGEEIA